MENDTLMLSLTIETALVGIPNGLLDHELFFHFQSEAVTLLKEDATVINRFGLVPDNGSDGIDDLLIDGILFRFDVPQSILGVFQDAQPLAIKEAFLNIVENNTPIYSVLLEEQGDYKNEKTIVFDFSTL